MVILGIIVKFGVKKITLVPEFGSAYGLLFDLG
jgi:hypothetical protein